MIIRDLFDPNKNINRSIEKVIKYGDSQERRLKSEITEYIVTTSIEEQFRKLLDKMELAMSAGGENEIGVWVSGFYGSGKSSFTKYLGLAFDDRVTIEGTAFLNFLQDRLNTAPVKAQLGAMARRFPAAIVMLDLASDMLAGATMKEVSDVLYFKVLQWAGYSRNLKVAALEWRLEKEGRYDEFKRRIAEEMPGVAWEDLQNDPLAVDDLVPRLAHEMYPALFPTATTFNANSEDFKVFESDRVAEMLDIVRRKSGKEYIIFVIDEVGQYVAARDNLILNIDGLAKNLKQIGDGKAWIVATAQQTLTEDDQRAALNSGKLYKLKDRFPIQVDLESRDIKEICTKRLLGKALSGQTELGNLFDTNGPALRHNTKLQDAKFYEADFTRETFIDLYPFLPAHFDILLHLLGALAKSTGGIGLRSAIKVIQDVLVEAGPERPPAAEQPVGWLATTVTLYDCLEKDIQHAFPQIHRAVENIKQRFAGRALPLEIAKSVAVLQVVGNLPVTAQNLAALMHPAVEHQSRLTEVTKTVEEMLNDPLTPLAQKDGLLHFLSEKLRDVEQERGSIALRSLDLRRIFNDALRETFDPLPRVAVYGSLSVSAGLKVQSGASLTPLGGESNPIQLVVELAGAADYNAAKTRVLDESRQRHGQNLIFLLGHATNETEDLTAEIYRCQRIAELHRNDPDTEVKEYCTGQLERANRLAAQLRQKLKQSLSGGSFLFRGQATAVNTLASDLQDAAKKILGEVAAQVFERYSEAPERVETTLAEKFLRQGNLAAITSALDPLGLVELAGGRPRIKSEHRALVSIRDFVERNGTVEGKRLLDHFSQPPFGWSQDTVRYLLAALLVAGEIKLRLSGREVTMPVQHALEALKTNRSFSGVGLSLRDERPSNETLARAAERLSELLGETILPLEQNISKAAVKNLPRLQQDYAPLAEKLAALGLPGAERVRDMIREMVNLSETDGSDAPQKLGAEESALFEGLKWAGTVRRALQDGLETTIRALQEHRRVIGGLPGSGVPGQLRQEVAEDLDLLSQRLATADFQRYAVDLNSLLTDLKGKVKNAVSRLAEQQNLRQAEGLQEFQLLPEWGELTRAEQDNVISDWERTGLTPTPDLAGLQACLTASYDEVSRLAELKERVRDLGRERQRQRLREEMPQPNPAGPRKLTRALAVPARLTSLEQFEALIRQLQEIKGQLEYYGEIEVNLTISGEE